jgi:undecaprenyl diphosphate synthase
VAIIMDGNGRWARRRRLPRIAGHRAGVRTIRPVTEECNRLGVHVLTLYAFSTENWSRPRSEVAALMRLFSETIDQEIDELDDEGIQLRILGRREELGDRLRTKIEEAEARTAQNSSNILNVAINYGGRREIVDAVRDLAAQGADLRTLEEADLSRSLYTAGLPDPDLIVRTAGELRISNFLLWQAAYAELYITETLWPDFGREQLQGALAAFAGRERRFGAIHAPPEPPDTAPASAASHGG